MSTDLARSRAQRKADVISRLEQDVDAWVSTASAGSDEAHLIPLSFLWDGETLLFATPTSSATGRNLRENGKARIGVGETRDVVLIEGTADAFSAEEIAGEIGDAFAAKTGFDPRQLTTGYHYFRIRPIRIQAWREANELDGRELMHDGIWLV